MAYTGQPVNVTFGISLHQIVDVVSEYMIQDSRFQDLLSKKEYITMYINLQIAKAMIEAD